tara:strand:- start:262 stop:1347 length:1086 start_codon:yes stop_codon:yes gene_type:complete
MVDNWTVINDSKASVPDSFTVIPSSKASTTDNWRNVKTTFKGGLDFISTWTTTSSSQTVTLPLVDDSNTINFTVDWGDNTSNSTITAYDDSDKAHVYAAIGTYTIIISGTISGFQFDNSGDKTVITTISQWGSFNMSTDSAFKGCTNLDITATDFPQISTTSLFETFWFCNKLTSIGSVEQWPTSNVTNMSYMFNEANLFNQDIGSLDTSNVTNMTYMFFAADAFNQDISGWDTSKVTTMYGMFFGADVFNQPIGAWDTSNVTNLGYILLAATAFDQDISAWDISSITGGEGYSLDLAFTVSGMSDSNYNAALIAWSTATHNSDVYLGFNQATPSDSAGEAARASLVADGWTIVDEEGTHT